MRRYIYSAIADKARDAFMQAAFDYATVNWSLTACTSGRTHAVHRKLYLASLFQAICDVFSGNCTMYATVRKTGFGISKL